MTPSLTEKQRRTLRALGHQLRPTVTIGQGGLSQGVSQELEQCLSHHQLMKVKLRGADRAQQADIIERLMAQTGALLIHRIGHVALIYRRNPDKPILI